MNFQNIETYIKFPPTFLLLEFFTIVAQILIIISIVILLVKYLALMFPNNVNDFTNININKFFTINTIFSSFYIIYSMIVINCSKIIIQHFLANPNNLNTIIKTAGKLYDYPCSDLTASGKEYMLSVSKRLLSLQFEGFYNNQQIMQFTSEIKKELLFNVPNTYFLLILVSLLSFFLFKKNKKDLVNNSKETSKSKC